MATISSAHKQREGERGREREWKITSEKNGEREKERESEREEMGNHETLLAIR